VRNPGKHAGPLLLSIRFKDRSYIMKKTALLLPVVLSAAALLGSCGKLDVVGTGSVQSFDKVLRQIPQAVMRDAANNGWSLAAPDNSVRFIWSRNYAESPLYDVMIEFDAAPFIAAGLDPAKLPENFAFREGRITAGAKLGTEELKYPGNITPLASYEQIVKLKRDRVGYHMAMDHYGVSLG
jgi:hypothetical protein